MYRPRSVPYAMRAKVEEEIGRLLKEGIISPVKYAEWSAPIVPVLKPEGSIRICDDYKLTVNSASSLEQYPIPHVEDLFNTLARGKRFSKLDLSHAYHQIVMDDEFKKYLTINTHRGLSPTIGLRSESHPLQQYFREQWRVCYKACPE